jgi:hypothetical protein
VGGGGLTPPPPPEIPKFWQSWAEFPVPWKIHLQQPNQNMGFTHLQIEWNPWLGGYRPQIPVLSALCPQLKKFLGTPLAGNDFFLLGGPPQLRNTLFTARVHSCGETENTTHSMLVTRWRRWLRHCKPEGSGLDSRWCNRDWLNSLGRIMTLGSTQSVTGGLCVGMTTLSHLHVSTV